MVVYYVMALALFASEGYEEVMRRLVQGLAWTARWRGTWRVPSSPAISKARSRLRPEVLAALFDRACVPVGRPGPPGALDRAWAEVAVGVSPLDVADDAANARRVADPASDAAHGPVPH